LSFPSKVFFLKKKGEENIGKKNESTERSGEPNQRGGRDANGGIDLSEPLGITFWPPLQRRASSKSRCVRRGGSSSEGREEKNAPFPRTYSVSLSRGPSWEQLTLALENSHDFRRGRKKGPCATNSCCQTGKGLLCKRKGIKLSPNWAGRKKKKGTGEKRRISSFSLRRREGPPRLYSPSNLAD